MQRSPLELERIRTPHRIPDVLGDFAKVKIVPGEETRSEEGIEELFPHIANLPVLRAEKGKAIESVPLKIGAVFSGGPAAGGHNVLAGLFDASLNGELIGFLGGPGGILSGSYTVLHKEDIDAYRNLGGFDLLGSGRTKIETEEQLQSALRTCTELELDGLVVIGGDDSNTNAAVLAEYFRKHDSSIQVIGVPKTIDGDLENPYVAVSFGFDTACRVYSEMIGNLCKDAGSARKYTHFIKVMGRSASHIALECALATHPNLTLIGEEIQKNSTSLQKVVSDLADLVVKRSKRGKNYGVILIPEGLIEFIPEISELIKELNVVLEEKEPTSFFAIIASLSEGSKRCFQSLPEPIQKQLLLRRDPHGNVQVSLIETEKLLAELTGRELERRKELGLFSGSFHPMTHFFGYEGRCSLPSEFDAAYCYALGLASVFLLRAGASGYMTFISSLDKPVSDWGAGGVPLTSLLRFELRKGKKKPVITKAQVSCEGASFSLLQQIKDSVSEEDAYLCPGPMQFQKEIALPFRLTAKHLQERKLSC